MRLINGPEAFTPDGEFPRPTDVRGFWVAAASARHGLAGAGGMGKLVAEWIVEGTPSLDVWHMDSRRFGAAYTTREYTLARTARSTRPTTTSSTPGTSGKPGGRQALARLSPLAGARRRLRREVGLGAGELVRAERRRRRREPAAARVGRTPLVARDRGGAPGVPRGGGALRRVLVREDRGRWAGGAAELLEWLCDNRVARDVGAITYTQMLNRKGGIECDFTVTRLAEDRFRIVTGTAFGRHDLAWIRQHAPDDGSVRVDDVTSSYACIGIWGRRAARSSPVDDDPLDFGHMRARELAVGSVPCLALRVTYVGELGWELYCPSEFGLRLWDELWGAGAATARRGRLQGDRLAPAREGLPRLGLGHHGRRHAGRGRARVRRQARQGLPRQGGARGARRARPPPGLPHARRPEGGGARLRAGADRRRALGRVTSGGYGYTVARSIAYAYLPAASAGPGTSVEVEIFGEWVRGEVAAEPLYDPRGERLRD